jgi:hypothetical protein
MWKRWLIHSVHERAGGEQPLPWPESCTVTAEAEEKNAVPTHAAASVGQIYISSHSGATWQARAWGLRAAKGAFLQIVDLGTAGRGCDYSECRGSMRAGRELSNSLQNCCLL